MFSQLFPGFNNLITIFSFINASAVFWLPFVLGYIAWFLWIDYKRRDFISKIKWKFIEIVLPQEITKNPLAMEVVLASLYNPSSGNWVDRYYKGRVRTWSSLELVSTEGTVRFYMRLQADMKNNLEAKIYSQYPGIEIYEAEDYAKKIDYNDGTWDLFGTEFKLMKPDPYPIKTYIDFGLGKEKLDPENQIDPLVATIEFMGSIKRYEHVWFQIMIQPSKKRFIKKASLFQKQDWKGKASEIVAQLKGGTESFSYLTVGEQNSIAAIQRAITKQGFDCGMRAIYIAKKDIFDPLNIAGMIGATKQYNAENMNGLDTKNETKFDFPWEDYKGRRLAAKKRSMWDAYLRRSYFYPPHQDTPFLLNTEELATIYHFPARITDTPGFVRIESQKSQPPSNLPI
jgi:hypothetical protein